MSVLIYPSLLLLDLLLLVDLEATVYFRYTPSVLYQFAVWD